MTLALSTVAISTLLKQIDQMPSSVLESRSKSGTGAGSVVNGETSEPLELRCRRARVTHAFTADQKKSSIAVSGAALPRNRLRSAAPSQQSTSRLAMRRVSASSGISPR